MMKRRWWFGVLSVLGAGLLLGACASASTRQALPESKSLEMENAVGMDSAEMAPAGAARGVLDAPMPDDTRRLVIRNADLALVVDDPAKAVDDIARLANEMGGFVVSAEVSERDDQTGVPMLYGRITVRVPAEKFDDAVAQIAQMGQQVDRRVSGQDVTEEYVDLQARLRNLEATREQLQRIMDDAVNTQDVLSVYRELSQVQGEIEQVKGRIKYLETSAAMSAISVDLTPSAAANPLTIGNWQPTGVAKEALVALTRTVRSIINIMIWVVLYIIPTLLLIALFGLAVAWPAWRLAKWALRKVQGATSSARSLPSKAPEDKATQTSDETRK